MKDTFTPPKSLVRYPKATIIILFISFFVMDYFTNIGLWGKILGIIVMWLFMAIDKREEQRNGFYMCIDQIDEMMEQYSKKSELQENKDLNS